LTAFNAPYPAELLLLARRVAWYEKPDEALSHLPSFIAQVMAYGSAADVQLAEQFISEEDFRSVLERAPAGVFTTDSWERWHQRLGIEPVPPLPRRIFPDGTRGPVAGDFFGR